MIEPNLIIVHPTFFEERDTEQNYIKTTKMISVLIMTPRYTLKKATFFNIEEQTSEKDERIVLEFLEKYNTNENYLIIHGEGVRKAVDFRKLDVRFKVINTVNCLDLMYPLLSSKRIVDVQEVLDLKDDSKYRNLLTSYMENGFSIETAYLTLFLKKLIEDKNKTLEELAKFS